VVEVVAAAQAVMEPQAQPILAIRENTQVDLALSDKVTQAVTDITAVAQDIQIQDVKDQVQHTQVVPEAVPAEEVLVDSQTGMS
jgi:hypothetical protein